MKKKKVDIEKELKSIKDELDTIKRLILTLDNKEYNNIPYYIVPAIKSSYTTIYNPKTTAG